MKTLWNINWSQYSWAEMWKIIKGYAMIISDITFPEPQNSNILHIGVKTCDLELLKKILLVEELTDINEKDEYGWTPLHIATYLSHFTMVKFLIEEKGANIQAITDHGNNLISLSVRNFALKTTAYLLEQGEYIAEINCIFLGSKTRKDFCNELCNYFEEKYNNSSGEEKFNRIFSHVKEIRDKYSNEVDFMISDLPIIGDTDIEEGIN